MCIRDRGYIMRGLDASGVHIATCRRKYGEGPNWRLEDAHGAELALEHTRAGLEQRARALGVESWVLISLRGAPPTCFDIPVDYRENPLVPEDMDAQATAALSERVREVKGDGPAIRTIATEAGLPINFVISACLLYTSPSPRDATLSRMPSSA